ncbi:MAG: hypothetical protein AABX07_05710 [Nanoarchaeota archaeon]
MKILHFSDTRLGYSGGIKLDSTSGVNLREKDVYDAFNHVLKSIEEKKSRSI